MRIFRIFPDSYTAAPPYIGIQKPQSSPPEMQKVSTRIIRVDTFNSSRLFT